MFPNFNFLDYFKEIVNSAKFQIAAAISFGCAFYLIWFTEADTLKITVTILFLFPMSMLCVTLCEKGWNFLYKIYLKKKRWRALTPEELEFIKYYLEQDRKTRYVPVYNGTWRDSGIINPLVDKEILYLASDVSEFRGESWMSRNQYFPFNITDEAFEYFKKKLKI